MQVQHEIEWKGLYIYVDLLCNMVRVQKELGATHIKYKTQRIGSEYVAEQPQYLPAYFVKRLNYTEIH